MTILKCPKCGAKRTEIDFLCPHCGCFFETNSTSSLFKVMLPCNVDGKLAAIKVVREITGWGLVEAKNVVESSNPMILENVDVETAQKVVRRFQEAGVDSIIVSANGYSTMVKKLPVCPICYSRNNITVSRKRSIWDIFLGKEKSLNICQFCGYEFESKT